ncbi:Tn3 family transposase [Pseudonocardia saturnea]
MQEGRRDLARQIFHDRRGDLRRAYHEGMQDDQHGALGLVLNCITSWITDYLDAARAERRGLPGPRRRHRAALALHASPPQRARHYSSRLPDLAGTRRALRDPDASRAIGAELPTSRRAVPDVPAP